MTRYEWIKQASKKQLAQMLCDMTEDIITIAGGLHCMDCPVNDKCGVGFSHENGYIPWLNEEVKYQETDDEKFCEIKVF